jgi:hypothetical protein
MEVRYQLRYSPVNQIILSVNRSQHTGCEYLFAALPKAPRDTPRTVLSEGPSRGARPAERQ